MGIWKGYSCLTELGTETRRLSSLLFFSFPFYCISFVLIRTSNALTHHVGRRPGRCRWDDYFPQRASSFFGCSHLPPLQINSPRPSTSIVSIERRARTLNNSNFSNTTHLAKFFLTVTLHFTSEASLVSQLLDHDVDIPSCIRAVKTVLVGDLTKGHPPPHHASSVRRSGTYRPDPPRGCPSATYYLVATLGGIFLAPCSSRHLFGGKATSRQKRKEKFIP